MFDLQSISQFVLRKQHLIEDTKNDDIVRITRDIGGLHATGATTPYLSLLARTNSFTRQNLVSELYKKKSLARIRYVRKTLYILPKEMLPSAFAAVKRNAEVMTAQHLEFMQLTPDRYKSLSRKILKILKHKGLTLLEIRKGLGAVPNLSYILRMMCFQGLLIRGIPKAGWKSNLHSYYPFREYYPDLDLNAVKEEDGQESVIRNYLFAFGPATVNDISWWTGFTKGQVKKILDRFKEDTREIEIEGLTGPYVLFADQEEKIKQREASTHKTVNLLPCLDPYLMGYKDRDRYLDVTRLDYIYDRSGNATSSILCDGQIVGVWDFQEPVFKYFLFEDVDDEVIRSIQAQAEKTGRFISGQDVQPRNCSRMVPLPKRTAGSFMTPLRGCEEGEPE
jgi:uncharacterized protein YcaQ